MNFDSLICMFLCCLFQLCFLHWCSWTDSFFSSFLSTIVGSWKSFLSNFQKDKTFLKYQSYRHFLLLTGWIEGKLSVILPQWENNFLNIYVLHREYLKQSNIWIFLVKSLNLLMSFAGFLGNSDIIDKYGLHIRFAIFAVFDKKTRWSFQLQISVNAFSNLKIPRS